MGLLKNMGKVVGRAIAQTGKATAAAIKKKTLQNRVEKMILDRFKTEQLKRFIKEYDLPGPELPERGYFKKEDYVNYAYHNFRLKTVIQWAQRHKIPIKDIMEYYIKEMEKIDRQYGKGKDVEEADEVQEVEEIEVHSEDFVAPSRIETLSVESSDPELQEFREILSKIETVFGENVKNTKITDEREFQNLLNMFLKSSFPSKKIAQHVDWRADILIDDKYALELKYADNRGTLDKGIREIKDYKKHTPYVGMIILDVGRLNSEVLENYITYYQEEGAEVVVVRGIGGRKRRKTHR